MAAQTTLVNFCVTEKGLEDQLLALVVDHERPDLQEQAAGLVRSLNEYNITLVELENNLLFNLANATVRPGGGGGGPSWHQGGCVSLGSPSTALTAHAPALPVHCLCA